ncbi:cyclic nucleotide-binding domain-containing protein [Methylocella silvestris]|uniref:Cyclic nucleotide-binding protein n=1 Tax=Methylocella silvestris TaxID=199596 RepID=A0A2J7TJD8_METSI|nr:cyclic nucleotide-binding domain-containing protein [Methylocella silvestris]PNG26891.1 cyclic nucleotide-binding protein [Methylocella silvestris]
MALEDDVAKLKRNAAFAALEPEALRLLAFSAETKVLRAGDILFRRDEPSNCGFLLLSGSIALDPSGEGSAAARILRPPALIGEIALITETLRPATAIAREPSTVLRLSQQMFRRVLSEYPQSAERLRDALAARLAEFTAEVEKALGAPLD